MVPFAVGVLVRFFCAFALFRFCRLSVLVSRCAGFLAFKGMAPNSSEAFFLIVGVGMVAMAFTELE